MTRSKHDEHFARVWERQAGQRERFVHGVRTDEALGGTAIAGKAFAPSERARAKAPLSPNAPLDQRAKADAGEAATSQHGRAPVTASSAPYPLVALCRVAALPEPTPEWEFHSTRKWRFDYAWPLYKVALEMEGGIWKKGGGAHSHPLNIERDCEKYSEAAILGWRILRVPPEKLRTIGMDYLFRIFGEK